MEPIEAHGRTVEEAVQAAAEQLGVTVDRVEYEVTEHGAKGFLGLGGTPATIRAWVGEGQARKPEPVRAEQETEEAGFVLEDEVEPAAEYTPEEDTHEMEEPEVAMTAEETTEAQPSAADEGQAFADALVKTLGEILEAMKLDAKPVLREVTSAEVVVNMVGSDSSILVGRQGQTLDALQYLVGIIANRSVPARHRVILDADGFRDRHRHLLEEKAREYAEAVKREGKEAVLDPQPARDRRIMHMALADDPDVYTYSEGEGEDRHLVISPKK